MREKGAVSPIDMHGIYTTAISVMGNHPGKPSVFPMHQSRNTLLCPRLTRAFQEKELASLLDTPGFVRHLSSPPYPQKRQVTKIFVC